MSSVATSQRLASQTAAVCSHRGSDEILCRMKYAYSVTTCKALQVSERPHVQYRGGGPYPFQMQRTTADHRRLRSPRFKYLVQIVVPRGCADAKTNLLMRHNRNQRNCSKVQHESERLEDSSVAETCRKTKGIVAIQCSCVDSYITKSDRYDGALNNLQYDSRNSRHGASKESTRNS